MSEWIPSSDLIIAFELGFLVAVLFLHFSVKQAVDYEFKRRIAKWKGDRL